MFMVRPIRPSNRVFYSVVSLLFLGLVGLKIFPDNPYRNWEETIVRGKPLYVGIETFTTGGTFITPVSTHHRLAIQLQTEERGSFWGVREGVPRGILDSAKEKINARLAEEYPGQIELIGYDQDIGFRVNSIVYSPGDTTHFGEKSSFFRNR